MTPAALARCERGSSPVEFVLVGMVLTALTLAVIQLAVAMHVRNVVHDAAVEGAFHAALADTALESGAARAVEIIARTVGDDVVGAADASLSTALGYPTVAVTVTATLPLIGLWGVPGGWEVTAHAPMETLE